MRKNRAFTLIEVMISIFIFTTSMLGYMAFHAHSMSVLFENESAQFAHALAFNLVEEFNSMSYDSFKALAGSGSVVNLQESTLQIALAIRDEVLDLEKNGIGIIQIDEAALREKLPLRKSDWYSEYLDWAIPAFRLVHSGVSPKTQIHTHMCYSEFTDIIPAIDSMDADVITFEASRSDLLILDALKENNFKTEVGPGVYDIHSPRVPSVEEIVSALTKIRAKTEDKKLWVNPDCGLKTRGVTETDASLRNLVAAAKIIRGN